MAAVSGGGGGGGLGLRDNANEGIMHSMFARIARFRIREFYVDIVFRYFL